MENNASQVEVNRQDEPVSQKQKKNMAVIVLAVACAVFLGVSVFFAIEWLNSAKEVEDLKSRPSSVEITAVETEVANNVESTSAVKYYFDETKIKNKNAEARGYDLSLPVSFYSLYVYPYPRGDKSTLRFYIGNSSEPNANSFAELGVNLAEGEYIDGTVKFDKNVADFVVDYKAVYVLLDDGSAEYVPLSAIKEGNIKSYGTIPGVEDVVKFYALKEDHIQAGFDVAGAQVENGDIYILDAMISQ